MEAYCALDHQGKIYDISPNLKQLMGINSTLRNLTGMTMLGEHAYRYLLCELSEQGYVFDLPLYVYQQSGRRKMLMANARSHCTAAGETCYELFFSDSAYHDIYAISNEPACIKTSIHGSVLAVNRKGYNMIESWATDIGYALPETLLHEAMLAVSYQRSQVLAISNNHSTKWLHLESNLQSGMIIIQDYQAGESQASSHWSNLTCLC